MSIEKSKDHGGIGLDMTHGPLLGKIVRVALPIAITSILQQFFNAADIAVVGQFAGSEAQAAVGSNAAIIGLMVNLFVGLSVGANAVIANYIGMNKKDRVSNAVHTSLIIAVAGGILLIIAGQILAPIMHGFIKTPDNVIRYAVLYIRIICLGMPCMLLYNFGAAILRSKGDTKRPLYCLTLSGIINVILNMILVIIFGMGVEGVAIATITANTVSCGMVLYILYHEDDEFRFRFKKLRIDGDILKKILIIGVPAGLQGAVFSISNVCIQSAVNSFGSTVMAASADAQLFEFLSYFVISAFSQTAVTFTSQNMGARQPKRMGRVFAISMVCAMASSFACCILLYVARYPVMHIFTSDMAVVEAAMERIELLMFTHWIVASYEVSASCMRGMGVSLPPALISTFGTVLFRLIYVFAVFPYLSTFRQLMVVYPLSWVLTGVIMVSAYFIFRKMKLRELEMA